MSRPPTTGEGYPIKFMCDCGYNDFDFGGSIFGEGHIDENGVLQVEITEDNFESATCRKCQAPLSYRNLRGWEITKEVR